MAKFVQAKFVQAKFAVTQSAPRYRARRRKILQGALAALMAIPLAGLQMRHVTAAERAVVIPSPALDGPAAKGGLQTAVLAGGCFWGVQAVYQHTKGVTKAVSGYAGGQKDTAHYDLVGTGRTGHAESVSITYDPQQISYGKILQIYFSVAHNPTQLNRQGPDFGTQYRSAIFYADDEQKRIAAPILPSCNRRMFSARRSLPSLSRYPVFMRPRIITRTFWSCTRAIPISCSTICRSSITSSRCSRILSRNAGHRNGVEPALASNGFPTPLHSFGGNTAVSCAPHRCAAGGRGAAAVTSCSSHGSVKPPFAIAIADAPKYRLWTGNRAATSRLRTTKERGREPWLLRRQ